MGHLLFNLLLIYLAVSLLCFLGLLLLLIAEIRHQARISRPDQSVVTAALKSRKSVA